MIPKRYRIYFIDGTNIVLGAAEVEFLTTAQSPTIKLFSFRDHDRSLICAINPEHITHIELDTPVYDASAVVNPPPAQTLRDQAADAKIEAVSTLDNVLAKPRSEA